MDSCICISSMDSVISDFLNEKDVRAKKHHKCTECARTISPGETYEYVFGKWDGVSSTFKTCSDCLSLRHVFFCGSWNYGELWEMVFDEIKCSEDIPIDELDMLQDGARKKMINFLDEMYEEDD